MPLRCRDLHEASGLVKLLPAKTKDATRNAVVVVSKGSNLWSIPKLDPIVPRSTRHNLRNKPHHRKQRGVGLAEPQQLLLSLDSRPSLLHVGLQIDALRHLDTPLNDVRWIRSQLARG